MDRSLATFLRSLQTSRTFDDAERLLPTATNLLARLANPLNLTLLSSQLLSNPSLFPRPIDLVASRRIFSVFYTAALRFVEDEENKHSDDFTSTLSSISRISWTKSVIQGADDKSPRWRHLLLIGGLLLGFEGQQTPSLPVDLRKKLEAALVTAANLALVEKDAREPNSQLCVVFVLNIVFPLISDHHRAQINYDLLLPELIEATFFSRGGLEYGYWLGAIDTDIVQNSGNRFRWSSNSPSAIRLRDMRSRVFASSLGPLSRLIAHSLENASDGRSVLFMVDRIAGFSRNLGLSWRQNKFSEIELSEEKDYLDEETIWTTLPTLLQYLRDTLFTIIVCLRAAIGRLLCDQMLASDVHAPTLPIQCLHILRDTYFISHRFGQTSTSQYAFVNYTSIDILNQFPSQAETFLANIRPIESGKIPAHPLDRIHDLFFLNIAEHFTLSLSPQANEGLLMNASMPYVTTTGDRRLNEIYEAAHSVVLAVFGAPQNAEVSIRHVPFYVETLLNSFPESLSPRQFRLAIRSIMQVTAPPSPASLLMPMMQATILEMLHARGLSASEDVLQDMESLSEKSPQFSEKTVLLLAVLDTLRHLPVLLLEDWLPISAIAIHNIANPTQKVICQTRFWEMLSNGEMDVERAAACVLWWTSKGGKELVMYGVLPEDEEGSAMSGAVLLDSKI